MPTGRSPSGAKTRTERDSESYSLRSTIFLLGARKHARFGLPGEGQGGRGTRADEAAGARPPKLPSDNSRKRALEARRLRDHSMQKCAARTQALMALRARQTTIRWPRAARIRLI